MGAVYVERHPSVADDIKVIGFLPLPKNRFSGAKLDIPSATRDGFKVGIAEVLKKRRFSERRLKCFHDLCSRLIQATDDAS